MSVRRLLVLVFALLAACATPEVLVPKSAAIPAGVDFSGHWRLRNNADRQQQRIDAAIRDTNGVDERDLLPPPTEDDRDREQPRHHGGLVYVFLQNGRELKVTQTNAGIFISFDRAVVDEYRFGENREVQVGPVIADRVSGWVGREYVVETLDENGMKLTERFALEQDGDVLRRTIVLRGRNKDQRTIVQTFDRIR